MKALGVISAIFALALGLAMIAPVARADEWNQATELTFNQPVQIPGNRVLPAGTYWFKLLDGNSNRNIVQVFDSNRSIVATAVAIPAKRSEVTDHTMLKLAEGTSHQPDVLVKWFYPGQMTGHEFLYSTPMESQISEDNVITVMAKPAPNGAQLASASY